MGKKFIARNSKRFRKVKFFLWITVIYLTFITVFNLLLKTSFNNIIGNTKNQTNFIKLGLNETKLFSMNLLNPEDMLRLSLNYILKSENISNNETGLLLIDKTDNDLNPRIYLYNTHQTETYDSALLQAYNISYTVETASYILRDYLKDYGIPCYVEQESMADYLSANGLIYKNSYEASRYYITKRLKEYPSIEFLIDLHRDSATAKTTKAEIDGVKYAKVMFVVGMDHSGYESNLHLVETLNLKLDGRLSRGISKKTGSNVNGIYNQDLSKNSILLEIGGVDNTIDEVNNTLKEIAKIIFEYINEGA